MSTLYQNSAYAQIQYDENHIILHRAKRIRILKPRSFIYNESVNQVTQKVRRNKMEKIGKQRNGRDVYRCLTANSLIIGL